MEGERQRLVRAAVVLSLRFETWASLTVEGLSDEDAVELMASLVTQAAGCAALLDTPSLQPGESVGAPGDRVVSRSVG